MIECKICGTEFTGHHKQLCCSNSCKKLNIHRIKRIYYERVVVPILSGPKTLKTKEEIKETERLYNNTPERKVYMKEFRKPEETRIKERASGKRYHERNPNVAMNGHLKRNYNITLDQYNEMLLLQDDVCAICKQPEVNISNKSNKLCVLAVDHCHSTGRVRGLLCWKCNTSLGKFKDSIEILQNAIDYLKKSRE